MNLPYTLILGSQSPRRSELLSKAGFSYEKRVIETDESYPPDLPIEQVAEHIALAKAAAHNATLQPEEVVLTADTIVAFQGRVYGKPTDKAAAISTLSALSGLTHTVYSGVCLRSKKKQVSFSVQTIVKFATLTAEEIEHYVEKFEPYDKAGSYGVQDWIGFARVEFIQGSYTNILGLPLSQTYDALLAFEKRKQHHSSL